MFICREPEPVHFRRLRLHNTAEHPPRMLRWMTRPHPSRYLISPRPVRRIWEEEEKKQKVTIFAGWISVLCTGIELYFIRIHKETFDQ